MVNSVPNPAEYDPHARQPRLMERAWNLMRAAPGPTSPYKVGEAVVGDDPFNGRREGVVVSRSSSFLGVGTAEGVIFYDHRQVKRQE